MKMAFSRLAIGTIWVGVSTANAHAADYYVAVLHSLTGPAAPYGVPLKDGALLAVDDLNKNNFLGAGNSLKAVVGDDASDRTQTVTLVNQYAVPPRI